MLNHPQNQMTDASFALVWDAGLCTPGNKVQGRLTLNSGEITRLNLQAWQGKVEGDTFQFSTDHPARLTVDVSKVRLSPGANASILTVEIKQPENSKSGKARSTRSFSVFLRDIRSSCPVYIPDCGVAVIAADDPRSYQEIAAGIGKPGCLTRLQQIEGEAEESYENAAAAVRRQPNCPTWLGLSRDMRTFLVNFRQDGEVWDWIQPQFHSQPVSLPENEGKPVRYHYFFGRGVGPVQSIHRWLEENDLPILHASLEEGDIAYHVTAFVSLEYRPLLDSRRDGVNLRGTHYLVADHFGYGNMQTPEQAVERERLQPAERARDEETVLYLRIRAVNNAKMPRYAWFKAPVPNAFHVGTTLLTPYRFLDGMGGYMDAAGNLARVYLTAKLNGEPLPQEELALLLQPGESAIFDLFLPHQPLSPERADALRRQDFDNRLEEVRAFWHGKLSAAARVRLPEKRIQDHVRAGLLHLDLVTYGLEPDGVTAPCIGVYCPIGSESSPIVQFYDAMGWADLARRSLNYFIAKQHEDGFMQNFGGYMLETGAALWSMGEHYRLTGDIEWIKAIEPNIIKACDYLLNWSRRNRREELRGRGYGLLDGKVGDPEDPYPIFMLNGYAYLGLVRSAEMLAAVNPAESKRLLEEAQTLKGYIRQALKEAAAGSPVVPLGDGRWIPALPPWAGYRGPVSLYAEGGNWFTHGAFSARDSLVGPLYLVFQEVIGIDELETEWLLAVHAELMTDRNVAFSQPYYARHDWVHLQRGEVKPFLKTYYNTLAALADRETFTFWEHFQLVSPHKTHEEAWFLMQTRWMLYLEEGNTLRLMPGIPRAWLEDGKVIEIDGMRSYFGALKVRIESRLKEGIIQASVEVDGNGRRLERVLLRLPHPQGKKPLRWRGAAYDPSCETAVVEPWLGQAEIILEF